MSNVRELAKLRIAAPAGNDTKAEILALFSVQGINPDAVKFVDVTPNVTSLVVGLADAVATYAVSAIFQAKEKIWF
jgi:ABC-type nitrate/sulfonate/bicarbonate transport system substrate-binding protein